MPKDLEDIGTKDHLDEDDHDNFFNPIIFIFLVCSFKMGYLLQGRGHRQQILIKKGNNCLHTRRPNAKEKKRTMRLKKK
jgi:hypothetical protein